MSKRNLPLHIVHAIKGETIALVAGGAGFLGSQLCEKLLDTCHVICVDTLRFGRRENITALFRHENFTFIEYDITRPITDLLRKKVSYIFYVAGADTLTKTKKASLDDLLINTYGTRNLLEKALSDKAKFLLVSTLAHERQIDETIDAAQARLFAENLTLHYIERFGLNGRIIRVGHLFGPRMPLDTENPIAFILKNLLEGGEVRIGADMHSRVYPVFVSDAVSVILQTMFSGDSRGKIFNLIPSQSVSLLELSQILAEIDPQYKIVFAASGHKFRVFAKEHFEQGTILRVGQKEVLRGELADTLKFFKEGIIYKGTMVSRQDILHARSKILTLPKLLVGLIFFTTILPVLLICLTGLLGIISLNRSQSALTAGQLKEAADQGTWAKQFFMGGQHVVGLLSHHPLFLWRRSEQRLLSSTFKTGEHASLTASNIANATFLLGEFVRKSIKSEGASSKSLLTQSIGELNSAATQLSILEKELEDILSQSLPGIIRDYIKEKKLLLAEHKETMSTVQTLVLLLPDLLGLEDKRTYLVLFQNNMELRPGGGFIGSYGILSFEQGSLISFDVFDVYAADGQLGGHVDPPQPIRNILRQPNWFLRDSNWDPDFQNAGRQGAWFLQKEVGTSVHGVIAIDVTFIKYLLEGVGPLTLPDYKDTITAQNLFERAEAHSERDFFPGSTQKKDFLGNLARRIIDRLLHEEDADWLSVLSALRRAMKEKHVLFALNNESVQKAFNLNNWGGAILIFEDSDERFNDFRMISEANLGVNKANYYVTRKIADEVLIGKDGDISGTLSITYTNESPSSWPGGPYVNYLRVLFPQKTTLSKIAIDGQEALASKEATVSATQIELEEATQSGKSVSGFLVTISAGSTKEVSISYQLSKPFPGLPGSTTYAYVFQKQPGTVEDPLTVTIHYPQALRIRNTNAQTFKEKQVVVLSTDLSEDRLFEVEFLR